MTRHDPSRRRAVDEIACGECGAPAGQDCTTAFGNRKWPPHKQRLDNAAERRRDQITEAAVLRGQTARVGSRVKHWGQRWTGCATATVVGFRDVGHASPDHEEGYLRPSWIKVLVQPDAPSAYGSAWDWDRTEVAPDV